jgi:integrase
MAVVKPGKVWWIDFWYAGRRIQESAKTSWKTLAIEYQRQLDLERAYAGLPVQAPTTRVKTIAEFVQTYRENYKARPKSVAWTKGRLAQVERLLGPVRLVDLTEDQIRNYIRTREQELKVFRRTQRKTVTADSESGRTINMEVGMLARAVGKSWSNLWPKVARLEERKDTGRALSFDEEQRILDAAARSKNPVIVTFLRILLLTAMRCGELAGMSWHQVNFEHRTLKVGRAKTSSGTGRVIPMNNELYLLLSHHLDWYKTAFGKTEPEWYLFPFGASKPKDPTRPTLSIKKAWGTIRRLAKVDCRVHDLRHTGVTKLAECGASDATIMAIVGHMSRAMLEHYSHVRMQAKRQAMESLSTGGRGSTSDVVPTKVPTTVQDGTVPTVV